MGKFAVSIAQDGKYDFNLVAKNGEIIGTSQGYESEESCMVGIHSVKENCHAHVEDQTEKNPPNYPHPKFEIFTGKDEQFYFHLKAKNGQIVLASEGYTAKESAFKGIQSVGDNAPEAPVEINK
ncbi:YegP family protein [Eubacteriales bacterium OttesenSCG-928-N13]|nr:YegP family protein [Eubacteriales bacterium OttesenSCG-928-N13]